MSPSQTPAYNLKVVLKETGIAADTLRAWERRYGIPMPQRTPGGHRLYSEHDIHLIKWLMARQKEGLSISRAADLWQELVAAGTDPLAGEKSATISESFASRLAPAGSLENLRREWLSACLEYNEAGAERVLNQAHALHPVETVVTGLIQAGLHELGEMWHRGQASVQQEHFASALAVRRLEALIAAAPPPIRKESILLACPPEEWHAFPLLLLSLLLRRRGWNTVYLGANVPLEEMDGAIQAVHPALVVMSAQGLVSAAALMRSAAAAASHGTPVAYGGRVFNLNPELRALIPGEFIGETLQQVPDRIEALLHEPHKRLHVPASKEAPLAQAYQLNRPLIEASMSARSEGAGHPGIEAGLAGIQLGRTIGAALELGRVEYVREELDWVRSLLAGRGGPADSLPDYITTYSRAVQKVMGETGRPIADWLNQYASEH